jgi:hypothetical protein
VRREFDIVAAWSVCQLGRSLPDLIGMLGKLRSRAIDFYLHQQALDTSTACWECSVNLDAAYWSSVVSRFPRPSGLPYLSRVQLVS